MTRRFNAFAKTPTGKRIMHLLDAPELVALYLGMTEIGKPAVQAAAPSVSHIIDTCEGGPNGISQFCGWHVGRIMRDMGFELLHPRGRIVNAPFKSGAVWHKSDPTPEVVEGRRENARRRIEMIREQKLHGPVYRWHGIQEDADGGRYVHSTLFSSTDKDKAIAEATAYAIRWQYPVICILDPQSFHGENA